MLHLVFIFLFWLENDPFCALYILNYLAELADPFGNNINWGDEVKGQTQYSCLRVRSVVFIVNQCSTFLKTYWLCYNFISYRLSHQLKLEDPHIE